MRGPHIHENLQRLLFAWVCGVGWEGQPTGCSRRGGDRAGGGGGGIESKAATPVAGREEFDCFCTDGLVGGFAANEDDEAEASGGVGEHSSVVERRATLRLAA